MAPRRKAAPAAKTPAPAKPRARKPPAAKPKVAAKAAPAPRARAKKAPAPAKAAKPPARSRARKPQAPPATPDLHERGARVLSVFGPFGCRTLIEMPTPVAEEIFGELAAAARSDVVEAVMRDITDLRAREPELANSALAASALALAYEIQHPYNSATSKSMCARAIADAMTKLREWAPPAEKKDDVDDLKARRATRRARRAAAADSPGPTG